MGEMPSAEQDKSRKVGILLEMMYLLERYNHQEGLGVGMANMLTAMLQANVQDLAEKERMEQQELDKQSKQQELFRQIQSVNSRSPQEIGLGFDFDKNRNVTIFVGGEQIQSNESHLVLKDGKIFTNFLASLTLEDLENKDGFLKKVLVDTISILVGQMLRTYDPRREDNRWSELMNSVDSVAPVLKQLGFPEQANSILQYSEFHKAGVLSEYLKIKATQCFDKPGEKTFGPSQWHLDSPADNYEARWNRSYSSVELAAKNQAALPIVQKGIANLIACIEYAANDIDGIMNDPTKTDDYYKKLMPKHKVIALTYKAKLETLKHSVLGKLN